MRAWISILILCLATPASAAPVQVENVRVWAAPDSTRVVFDVSGPVDYELAQISNPFRVVIDLVNTELVNTLTQPISQDKYLQRLRGARHEDDLRVVLDLKKFALAKSFQLTPNQHYGHRLVIYL